MTRDILQVPADTLLADELAEDDVVEMANLTPAQTGVPGTIFISTAMVGHGPRVKYFLQLGRSQPSLRSLRAPSACATACDSGGPPRPFPARAAPRASRNCGEASFLETPPR